MRCFRTIERKHTRNYFDFHLHSNRNGGLLSPREIALEIHKLYLRGKFLEKVSLTDHETLEGQQEFLDTIELLDFGKHSPTVYFGVEIPLILDFNEEMLIHILTYSNSKNTTLFNLRSRTDSLFERLNSAMHSRGVLRAKNLISFAGDECPITLEDVYSHARFGKYVSDISIIRALQTSGKFQSERELQDFLHCFNPPHEKIENSFWPRAREIIPSLSKSFDYISLAHPYRISHEENLDAIISELVNLKGGGINSLEAYHPSNSPENKKTIVALAQKFDLYLSGGSDTHFYRKPYCIGISIEDVDKSRLI